MKMKKKKISVAVVGATGLVGRAFLRCMEKAEFVPEKLSLFASEKSDGQELEFNGEKHRVSALGKDSFAGVDLALFSAGGEVSGMYAPVAVLSGAVVIDNSSRWRMDKDVPLVVPEINLADARGKKLVANPNCSTIQAALPLWALRDTVPHSVAFTTFQAVSGTGKRGLDALENARAGRAGRFFRYGYFLDLFAPNRRFSVGRQHGGGSKDDKRNQKNSPQTRFENFRNLRARTRAQRSRSQHSHARGQGF